jgi:hypothetical protein
MHMEEGELVICQEYSPIKEQILSSQCSISHDKTSPRNVWSIVGGSRWKHYNIPCTVLSTREVRNGVLVLQLVTMT